MRTNRIIQHCALLSMAASLAACGGTAATDAADESGSEDAPTEKSEELTAIVNAPLMDANGKRIGEATIAESDGILVLTVKAEALSTGLHGVHVHQTGECTAPDFKSAGGHWNPRDVAHGLQNPDGAHSGDLPNMAVGPEGKGELTYNLGKGSINDGEFALMDSDGAAFIIHGGEDDQKSSPSGNSGARVACGVFAPAS